VRRARAARSRRQRLRATDFVASTEPRAASVNSTPLIVPRVVHRDLHEVAGIQGRSDDLLHEPCVQRRPLGSAEATVLQLLRYGIQRLRRLGQSARRDIVKYPTTHARQVGRPRSPQLVQT
jgi:hypothetical protein